MEATIEEVTPPDVKPAANGKKKDAKAPKPEPESRRDGDPDRRPVRSKDNRDSVELSRMRISEDATVREIVEQLGVEGSFTIKISRKDPEYTRDASGKQS